MSRAYIEPGDGKKKQHKVMIRAKKLVSSHSPAVGVISLEITTTAEDYREPFVMDVEGGEVFTVVIED